MNKLKIISFFFIFIFVSNCTISGTAFLGPAVTGAKTGSIYQSSLSYTSNKVINQLKSKKVFSGKKLKKIFPNTNPTLPDIPFTDKNPVIVLAYKVDNIEFSDVVEPEPLP